MPKVESEVEKPVASGAAMEITVSRQDLVKELTATQSVVERKTTIPICRTFSSRPRRTAQYHRD
jgi:DNA polymerase-3 subunit beta